MLVLWGDLLPNFEIAAKKKKQQNPAGFGAGPDTNLGAEASWRGHLHGEVWDAFTNR